MQQLKAMRERLSAVFFFFFLSDVDIFLVGCKDLHSMLN